MLASLSEINYSDKKMKKVLKKQFKEAFRIYEKEIFPSEYSIFTKFHELLENEEEDHNCIGCNLNDSALLIYTQLLNFDLFISIRHNFTMYIMTLYLMVERVDTLLNIISINETYKKDKFKTLIKIRKWANFIKHPKAFLLVHHPEYTFEGSSKNSELRKYANQTIDYNRFILPYYSNDDKNKELYEKLENKEKILVAFPNPIRLMEEFCKELKLFKRLIKKNEVFRDVLNRRSTFLGFWENFQE